MEWFRAQYLPDPSDWDSPLASPIEAADLSGVCPAMVVTAGFDPLRDEGRQYADRLAEAGVPVRYRCYDDMVHGFFGMGVLPGEHRPRRRDLPRHGRPDARHALSSAESVRIISADAAPARGWALRGPGRVSPVVWRCA